MKGFLEDADKFTQTILLLRNKFENVRKFFDDYAGQDELIQSLLKMVDRSRELNPVKKSIATICRYDYMMDDNE